jgi:putative aldouronate transport system permease protein
LYVLSASLSSPGEIARRSFLLWPAGFQIDSYIAVFQNPAIRMGYLNTLFYVTVGTFLNLLLTLFAAYSLSRRWFKPRNAIMFFVTLTMFISGGLIPWYLLITKMGMYNTRLAMILPTAISTYNLIITRTYFLTAIPDSMEESAKIDGANDYTILFKIMVPLAKPIIAVIGLFYAVTNWNSWFNASILLRDRNLFPVQLVLREILILNSTDSMINSTAADKIPISENIKYATIIVTTLPILLVYPSIQKYFVQGVMIGAIKE